MDKLILSVSDLKMEKYILINHTADIGIDVFGNSLQELFTNAAFALFDIIADLSKVEGTAEYAISVSGIDREQLMVNWLSELLYLHDVKNLLFRDFCITDILDNQLNATVRGEAFREDKHVIKTGIKAVTYHCLSIVLEDNKWKARIIFDI
ncbi:MAG: archease [Candidatus Brocadia sp.]